MTYGEIYKEFLSETKIDAKLIDDYRNCCETYGFPYIPYAIIVWLKNGSKIIYISDNAEKLDKERDNY